MPAFRSSHFTTPKLKPMDKTPVQQALAVLHKQLAQLETMPMDNTNELRIFDKKQTILDLTLHLTTERQFAETCFDAGHERGNDEPFEQYYKNTYAQMTNQLLEQCRKEAEELYPYGKVNIDSYNYAVNGYRNSYVSGCKATHEKMMGIIFQAYKTGFKFANCDNESEHKLSWESFKQTHNL